jgi:hypothetical protein
MLLKRVLPVALTFAIGLLVLISFVVPGFGLFGVSMLDLRRLLIQWAVILAAGALILGFVNLIVVHARRIRQGQGVIFSVVLIASALITMGLWFGSLLRNDPSNVVLDGAFNLVIAPAQSALGVLLAVLLAVAGFRALQMRRTVGMFLFVLTAAVVALTQPVVPLTELLRPIRDLIDPITTGSLRGLLLGVALGGVAFGLRVLVGADKPQGD